MERIVLEGSITIGIIEKYETKNCELWDLSGYEGLVVESRGKFLIIEVLVVGLVFFFELGHGGIKNPKVS